MQRYQIYGRLAAGAMGEVLLARERSRAGRLVAVKRMLVRSDEATTQLLEEARVCATVAHPHVVGVLDVGADEDGPFLVLEYVHGATLGALADRAVAGGELLPVEAVARAIHDVALGLAAAHDAGVVHRDVKPSNILVSLEGQARVADFGIAYAAKRLVAPTEAGFVRGTLRYMSPEQLEAKDVGAASDQFALGIVLWEALAGAPLFYALGDHDVDVARRVLSGRVPPLRSLRDDVPRALEAAVLRMLARRPGDRFPSCAAAAAALRAAFDAAAFERAQEGLGGVARLLVGRETDRRLARLTERTAFDVPSIHALNTAVEAPTLTSVPRPVRDDAPRTLPPIDESVTSRDLPTAPTRKARRKTPQASPLPELDVDTHAPTAAFAVPSSPRRASPRRASPPAKDDGAPDAGAVASADDTPTGAFAAATASTGVRPARAARWPVAAAVVAVVAAACASCVAVLATTSRSPGAAVDAPAIVEVPRIAPYADPDGRAAQSPPIADHAVADHVVADHGVADHAVADHGAVDDGSAAAPAESATPVSTGPSPSSARHAARRASELPERAGARRARARAVRFAGAREPHLVLAVDASMRASAQQRLRGCRLARSVVGVVRARPHGVAVTSQPRNECVERALAHALRGFKGDVEPYQIDRD